MEENYTAVPNIISGKDLDYLSDMFNWNYGAYKNSINAKLQDEELNMVFNDASNLFKDSMNQILNILGGNNE